MWFEWFWMCFRWYLHWSFLFHCHPISKNASRPSLDAIFIYLSSSRFIKPILLCRQLQLSIWRVFENGQLKKIWQTKMLNAVYANFSILCLMEINLQLEAPGKTLCRMCACSPQLSAPYWKVKMNVWISRAASKPQSQLDCDKVWHACHSLILALSFSSFSLTLHLNTSLLSLLHKQTGTKPSHPHLITMHTAPR